MYYSDAKGLHLDAPEPVRQVLTLIDGIVAGEGNGPLAPTDVPRGAVIASLDPVAADLVALALMGYRPDHIPKIREPMRDPGPRITRVRTPDEVVVHEVVDGSRATREAPLATHEARRGFRTPSRLAGPPREKFPVKQILQNPGSGALELLEVPAPRPGRGQIWSATRTRSFRPGPRNWRWTSLRSRC